jgi:hypothetical protein
MAELTFEKKRISRFRNRFPAGSDIAEVMATVLGAKTPGEIRIGIPGNGGVSFIEFLEKEKAETIYYEGNGHDLS